MNDGDEHDELETAVAKTRERASAELDARVLRSIELAAGIAGAVQEFEEAPAPRRAWRRVAALAAGILVLASVGLFLAGNELGWFGRAKQDGAVTRREPAHGDPPAAAEQSAASIEPAAADAEPWRRDETPRTRPSEPEASGGEDAEVRAALEAVAAARDAEKAIDAGGSGWMGPIPNSMDASITVSEAPAIALLRTEHEGVRRDRRADAKSDESPFVRLPIVKVLGLYSSHGFGAVPTPGAPIVLLPSSGSPRRSFLDWCSECREAPFTRGATFIACVTPAPPDPQRPGTPRFAIAYGTEYACTLVADDLPRLSKYDDPEKAVARLRADLIASLDDASASVRLGAITALRHFDAASRKPAMVPELSEDAELVAALLRLGDDVSARIRWNVALMDPAAWNAEGIELSRRLLFDADPLVRLAVEDAPGSRDVHQELLPVLREGRDPLFAEFTSMAVDPAIDGAGREITAMRVDTREGVEAAITALSSSVRLEVRVRAAIELQLAQPTTAVIDALVAAIRSRLPEVGRFAAFSLAGMIGEQLEARTRMRFSDAPARMRVMAAIARLRRQDPSAVPLMRAIILPTRAHDSGDPAAHEELLAAVEGVDLLWLFNDTLFGTLRNDCIEILLEAADAGAPLVRARAVVALARWSESLDDNQRSFVQTRITSAAASRDLVVVVAAAVARGIMIARTPLDSELETDEMRRLRQIGYAVEGK